jgi:hypothetical protein
MELAPFESVDPSALRWLLANREPPVFELSSGDTAVARLTWARPGGSLVSLATSGGAWTFKRIGFLHPRITARVEKAASDLAQVSLHLNHHRIELMRGTSYRFHRAGLLVPAWVLTTDSGVELLHVEPVREGRRLEGGAVLTSPVGRALPDLPLLIGLTWYLIVLSWFEDEALVPLEGPDTSGP